MPAPSPVRQSVLDEVDDLVGSFLAAHAGAGGATVSVWCGDLGGGAAYARAEHEPHYAASTMKLPLLVAAYRRAERGELDLDAQVPVHNTFRSAADGSPFGLDRADDQDDETWALLGASSTLRRLARHATVRSGNLATNLLLEQVGAAEVAAVLSDAGCSADMVLPRGIEDAAARESGLDNKVTAHGLARVMAGIGARTLAGSRTCEEVERLLAQQEYRDKIPAGLPPGTYVANKTGWVDGVTHDVALVRPTDAAPYVLAVCTTVDVDESAASGVIAGVSRLLWEGRRR